jgi:hypothetical protein
MISLTIMKTNKKILHIIFSDEIKQESTSSQNVWSECVVSSNPGPAGNVNLNQQNEEDDDDDDDSSDNQGKTPI